MKSSLLPTWTVRVQLQKQPSTISFSELADVASQLPLEWDAPNYGRATKGAALAYIARTKLYAASKLNNPSMDRKKWEDARDALSAVMGLNIYDLYYDTQNSGIKLCTLFLRA